MRKSRCGIVPHNKLHVGLSSRERMEHLFGAHHQLILGFVVCFAKRDHFALLHPRAGLRKLRCSSEASPVLEGKSTALSIIRLLLSEAERGIVMVNFCFVIFHLESQTILEIPTRV